MISLEIVLSITRQQFVLVPGLQNSILKSQIFRILKIT